MPCTFTLYAAERYWAGFQSSFYNLQYSTWQIAKLAPSFITDPQSWNQQSIFVLTFFIVNFLIWRFFFYIETTQTLHCQFAIYRWIDIFSKIDSSILESSVKNSVLDQDYRHLNPTQTGQIVVQQEFYREQGGLLQGGLLQELPPLLPLQRFQELPLHPLDRRQHPGEDVLHRRGQVRLITAVLWTVYCCGSGSGVGSGSGSIRNF